LRKSGKMLFPVSCISTKGDKTVIVSITFNGGHKIETAAAELLAALLQRTTLEKAVREERETGSEKYRQINFFLSFTTMEDIAGALDEKSAASLLEELNRALYGGGGSP